jgi:hypothetical protein
MEAPPAGEGFGDEEQAANREAAKKIKGRLVHVLSLCFKAEKSSNANSKETCRLPNNQLTGRAATKAIPFNPHAAT